MGIFFRAEPRVLNTNPRMGRNLKALFFPTIVTGIGLYLLSLVLQTAGYSSFSSYNIVAYQSLNHSNPALILPFAAFVIMLPFFINKFTVAIYILSSLAVFFEGLRFVDFGTDLPHGPEQGRELQETLIYAGQLLKLIAGMTLLGAPLALRVRK